MIHKVTIGIDAPSEQQAVDIATDLVEIKNALSDRDIKELKMILKRNPGIVKTVRKILGIE